MHGVDTDPGGERGTHRGDVTHEHQTRLAFANESTHPSGVTRARCVERDDQLEPSCADGEVERQPRAIDLRADHPDRTVVFRTYPRVGKRGSARVDDEHVAVVPRRVSCPTAGDAQPTATPRRVHPRELAARETTMKRVIERRPSRAEQLASRIRRGDGVRKTRRDQVAKIRGGSHGLNECPV